MDLFRLNNFIFDLLKYQLKIEKWFHKITIFEYYKTNHNP